MQHRLRLGLVVGWIVLSAQAAPAASDPSTPKGALRVFYEALEAGDAAAVRASLHATSDAERQLADAYAAQLTAAKALGDAARAKFAAAGDTLSRGLPARDEIAAVDAAQVKIEGTRATVRLPGRAKPLTMTQADGRWRLSVADYAGAATPDALASQAAVLNDMAGVFESVAADIAGDKFATAPDAQRALQKKLQGILFTSMQKNPPPTTGPSATQPSALPKP
jgi:hypothetical protein